jgi:hypothetical protein
MSDPLTTLADRAATDPFCLAHRLAAYQDQRNLSDAELVRDFGCAPEVLTMIRLCRAPRDRAEGVEDVRCVAERFDCDPGRLAEALGSRQG